MRAETTTGRRAWLRFGGCAAQIALLMLLLWGLNMRRGLNHDEHQFVASGALLARDGLLPYRDFPYFHVPVLSLLYALLFQFTSYLLLAARTVSIVCSGLLLALLLAVALKTPIAGRGMRSAGKASLLQEDSATADLMPLHWRFAAGASAVLLLMASDSFIHASGRAWNHDLPVLLTAAAACLFVRWLRTGADGAQASPPALRFMWPLALVGALLGLAAGTRSSFGLLIPAFVIALIWAAGRRERRTWPALAVLALGGLIGLAPTIYLFALAPERFLFGNWSYAALNTAYYAALPTPPPAMTLAGKFATAAQWIVTQPGNLLLVLVTTAALGLAWASGKGVFPERGLPGRGSSRKTPELRFALLLLPFLLAGAFAPTPLQEQYIYPLFPWCAFTFLAALRYVRSPRPLLIGAGAAAALAVLLAAPRYGEGAEVALRPDEWEPLKVHARGERLAQLAGGERVLTLAPIFPLEGGAPVYPQLVSGPLGFRVAALLAPAERQRMGLVGPDDLAALFAEQPPRAVFTGVHDSDSVEEEPLAALAAAQGYVPVPEQEPAILWSRPLANFGDAIRLGAVDLPPAAVPPGSDLLLTFYLQAVAPLDRNWNVLVRLAAPDGSDLARSEGWPWGRPTVDWTPGEVWPDGHTLSIPADAAPGSYRLEVSFYDPETLDLLGAGPAAVGFVVVDPCAAGGTAANCGSQGAPVTPPAQFGDCLQLLTVDLPSEGWRGGESRTVRLTWQRTDRACGRYTAFVHLAGPQGLAAQRDQEPLGGFYPTDAWLLHTPVTDSYDLALPPDLPPGDYQLLVGFYDAASGQRLPLLQNGQPSGDAYLAGTIEVAGE